MSNNNSEKSIELYKIILFIIVIIVLISVVTAMKKKKAIEKDMSYMDDEVTQVSISPNKTSKEIVVKLESIASGTLETQELNFDAVVGESIRFKEFYIIPQEVNDNKIVFKIDASSNLQEFDSQSQMYVKKDLYTINKGESIRFADGVKNENAFILTY